LSKVVEWTVSQITNGLAVSAGRPVSKLNELKATVAVVNGQRLSSTKLSLFNKSRLDKLVVR